MTKTYNDGLRAAALIARGYKGSAERERKAKGIRLGGMSEECRAAIRDEERGEDIAAERISLLILAALEPYENPNR